MHQQKNDETKIFHKPVLVQEVITYLNPKPGGLYVDATFGGGGHTRAILEAEPTCKVVAIDWDTDAINKNAPQLETEFGQRFKIIWGNFSQLYKLLKKEKISKLDGILADFGTSQFQIHCKAGFSFQTNSYLDMRMAPGHQQKTAADIINNASEKELLEILFTYGEESNAKKIVRAIVALRKTSNITTTKQLTDLIESIISPNEFGRQRKINPATKTFQALRIAVNHELDNIINFLKTATLFLQPGGRFVCISFHSLEDRIVKNFFRDNNNQYKILTTKPIVASERELIENLSSRSAKLRTAEKL
jgi:16S rRNA (cytosine1402-N4)-methyltransferase